VIEGVECLPGMKTLGVEMDGGAKIQFLVPVTPSMEG
jgi:hypothetical protein